MRGSGPQGLYEVRCRIVNNVSSAASKVMLTSPAHRIIVLGSREDYLNTCFSPVGKPLNVMPTVRVLDSNGQPLAGIANP